METIHRSPTSVVLVSIRCFAGPTNVCSLGASGTTRDRSIPAPAHNNDRRLSTSSCRPKTDAPAATHPCSSTGTAGRNKRRARSTDDSLGLQVRSSVRCAAGVGHGGGLHWGSIAVVRSRCHSGSWPCACAPPAWFINQRADPGRRTHTHATPPTQPQARPRTKRHCLRRPSAKTRCGSKPSRPRRRSMRGRCVSIGM